MCWGKRKSRAGSSHPGLAVGVGGADVSVANTLCQKAFQGNATLMRAFFTAYGWPLPVPPDVKRRLKLYTLLHRFPPLGAAGPSLEAILDAQWPI